MAIGLSDTLSYYKRQDIRDAMVVGAIDKEVAIRYGENGYGKRPDMITVPSDILELVKKGATSFHASEELWINPMAISPQLSKKELSNLRKGWDLVLDIDCPYWLLAKTTAKLMVKALNDNGVNESVSIKFSGNKGFHIGVPFEAFPKMITVKGETFEIEKLFPDAARKVALYIVDFIADKYIKVDGENIHFEDKVFSIQKLKEITGKNDDEITIKYCSSCKKELKIKEVKVLSEFICPRCESREKTESDDKYLRCKKCSTMMQRIENKKTLCVCGSNDYSARFNPLSIVEVDTILISSRHLYRMEFSMHEKSGLVSVPFNPAKIDVFEKDMARPDSAKVSKYRFLDRTACVENEAKQLFLNAYDYNPIMFDISDEHKKSFEKKEFEIPDKAIPEEYFPPCIVKGLKGMEDGKKRFLFALTNFLQSAGWDAEMIEKRVRVWNDLCPNPLREQYFLGHLRYQKQHKKNAPPPNCNNNMYYKDLGICFRESDNLCQKIKNPSMYSKRKENAVTQNAKKERKPKVKKESKKEDVKAEDAKN